MFAMLTSPASRQIARLLWTSAGSILLVLGAIGVVLPVMPTTVFWLGAVACFARSHPAVAERLLAHPVFGPSLKRYRDHGVIDSHGKRVALTAIAVSGLVAVATGRSPWMSVGVCACLAAVAFYIATRPAVVPPVGDRESTGHSPR